MNIFIITSTLKPKIGIIDPETRYQQTLKTIQSIKDKAPGSMIILVDSSPDSLEQDKIDTLRTECNYFVSLSNHELAKELANKGLKSQGECYIMLIALDIIRSLSLKDVNRVFKITGRAELTEHFHIEDYENPKMKNLFVFKTPVVSWMSSSIKLVDTRLWSFDFNMLDSVEEMIRQAYEDCMKTRFDLEHVYYRLIKDERIFPKDVIGLKCIIASDGTQINE